MAEALKRPGGELASRPLHVFWAVDCSGSMYGEKIGTVNHAIQSTIPEMVDAAKDNPNAQLLVRTLKFSTGATWVTPDPVNIEDFAWDDLDAGGVTDLGKAFEMLAAQLTIPPMTDRALPPVIVLLSDGQPTDDYKKSLDKSFDGVLREIEMTRMQLYEVDKRTHRKSRRKINGKEREFYYITIGQPQLWHHPISDDAREHGHTRAFGTRGGTSCLSCRWR